ncbi:DUF6624 domain-containing protein [Streptomyces sp. CWNU-52B]|uniref:DUF6624 domain-containing protein n=1 Tax=unclassified Streptomyces TaxID=2593676 RepID=UPI0039BF1F61
MGETHGGYACDAADMTGEGRTGLAHDGVREMQDTRETHGVKESHAPQETREVRERCGVREPYAVREGHPAVLPALASALARELVRRVEEDHRVTREARRGPTRAARHRLAQCRANNTEALRTIVRRHAWPTADLVGAHASTAALMILLHATDLDFQLACRDLIAQAVADGHCPAPHHAFIADHCAVELGQPQFYGTRVDPATFHPYPVRQPGTVDERRCDVGLAPLDEQMRTLRLSG